MQAQQYREASDEAETQLGSAVSDAVAATR
jgi:hypothetical protein